MTEFQEKLKELERSVQRLGESLDKMNRLDKLFNTTLAIWLLLMILLIALILLRPFLML